MRKEGSQERAARELFVFTIEELEGQSRRHSWRLCTEALRSGGGGENGGAGRSPGQFAWLIGSGYMEMRKEKRKVKKNDGVPSQGGILIED